MSSKTITIEGRWAVEAALQSPFFCVREVLVESDRHAEIAALARAKEVNVEVVSKEAMAERAGFEFHRGVLAWAARPAPKSFNPKRGASSERWVVPDGLADGGNLGTIIRTAAAFGADGILLERGKGADVYSRKCIRSSATAVFRLPVYEVESLPEALMQFKEAEGEVLGTSLGEGSTPLAKCRVGSKSAVLLGAEKDGLSEEIEAICDQRIYLPMEAGMDSLNVAATASIVLYELFGRDG